MNAAVLHTHMMTSKAVKFITDKKKSIQSVKFAVNVKENRNKHPTLYLLLKFHERPYKAPLIQTLVHTLCLNTQNNWYTLSKLCAPAPPAVPHPSPTIISDLFLSCYENDFMLSISPGKRKVQGVP